MLISKSKAATSAIVGIYRLLLFISIIGCLYYGQSLVIPLTVAALLTFILSPLVKQLESWLGRIIGISIALILFIMTFVIISYILTNQAIEFTNKLPHYRTNIENKLNSFTILQNNPFVKMSMPAEKSNDQSAEQNASISPKNNHENLPIHVNILSASSSDLISFIKTFLSSLINILGSTGLILLLVIFMLFNREDLRGRFIRLIGPRRISTTTRAIDEASTRLISFLYTELFINLFYGIIISVGLYLLDIPNAILWGGLGALLRFIPYIGAWVAAIIPCFVALAISTTWLTPLLTIGLFGVVDLIVANIVEPLLFSSRTGISPLGLIVSAVCWTLLWGPIGLLLSIPLTVCIVVMGRHIPNLDFISTLLSDEEALALYEECYHRLITGEISEAMLLITNYLKTTSLTNLYDTLFIPIFSIAATDHRQEYIDDEQLATFYQNLQDILNDVYLHASEIQNKPEKNHSDSVVSELPEYKILCIPVESEADEIASTMLMQLLNNNGFHVDIFLEKLSHQDILNRIEQGNYDTICISLMAPAPLIKARALFKLLHRYSPDLKIVLGLWGHTEINTEVKERLQTLGVNFVVLSLSQAVETFEQLRAPNGDVPLKQ